MYRKNLHFFRIFIQATLILILAVGGAYAQKVPTPEEFLGFKVGADYHLIDYDQALEYFMAMDKASPKLKVFELGKTEMGRSIIGAIIN